MLGEFVAHQACLQQLLLPGELRGAARPRQREPEAEGLSHGFEASQAGHDPGSTTCSLCDLG